MKIFKIIILFFFLVQVLTIAQTKFPNTLSYVDSIGSPKADLQDVAWVAGHWKGSAFGGTTEELWSPPSGESMMGVFKLIDSSKVVFYEIMTIKEENETLIFRLKHFDGNLKGWEEKDETVNFKLVKVIENKVYFDGFTFEKISDNEINMYVRIKEKNKTEEVKFNYKRVL